MDMSTDAAWEEWGRRDPYFGVITDPKFRMSAMDAVIKKEFFDSGESDVHYVMTLIKKFIDPGFAPKRVLDFGCGVGRTLVPLAKLAEQVVGIDVSRSMLQEARKNCDARQLRNVSLLESDDDLTTVKACVRAAWAQCN
jgi:2-polyprenyl-3-methyl-5-hydroxy-6-metoxy-1,4-benzoquinol methylase